MNKPQILRLSALAAALASTLVITEPAWGQTTPPTEPPPVVIEDRSLRVKADDRDVTLSEPLEIRDGTGSTLLNLPAGTLVGRERMETRFAAPDQPIRNRADLRDVTLGVDTSVTDPRTGTTFDLPAGTVIRVKMDLRRDAAGNIVRDRVDLRATRPDGTQVRIRNRAPELEVDQIENEVDEVENEVGDNRRQRGRDGATSGSASGRSVARAERSGRGGGDRVERSGRSDRPDRVERSGRPERPDRPERSGRGGGSGPG